jgi:hypothetical protein
LRSLLSFLESRLRRGKKETNKKMNKRRKHNVNYFKKREWMEKLTAYFNV